VTISTDIPGENEHADQHWGQRDEHDQQQVNTHSTAQNTIKYAPENYMNRLKKL